MTDVVVLAILSAVPATIVALGGLIVSIRNGKKADIIKKDVNSNATAARNEIAALKAEVDSLKLDRADKKETAALLAAAVVEKERKS